MAAHEKDIVHRDIKPENLFLVGEGAQRTVKVLDFGISRVGDAQNSYTKTGIVIATIHHQALIAVRGVNILMTATVDAGNLRAAALAVHKVDRLPDTAAPGVLADLK